VVLSCHLEICKNVLIPSSDPTEAFITSIHFTTVQIYATGWTVRGSNPGGGEIFCTRSDLPWDQPSLLYNGYQTFPGGKAVWAWRWPPTPSNAEVKEREELYRHSPNRTSWPVLSWTFTYMCMDSYRVDVSIPCLYMSTGTVLQVNENRGLWFYKFCWYIFGRITLYDERATCCYLHVTWQNRETQTPGVEIKFAVPLFDL